jgi:FkbM family methyltransferase
MEYRSTKWKEKEFQFCCEPDKDATYKTYEDESNVRDILWQVKPGDLVFDAGACFGSYTLCSLAAGASYVYAWSPLEFERNIFHKSLRINGWGDRCTICPFGLHEKYGFFKEKGLNFSTETGPDHFEVRSIDSHMSDFGTPKSSWFKIDVEGAEIPLLNGAIKFIAKFQPHILIECHNFLIPTIIYQVQTFMQLQNYQLKANLDFYVDDNPTVVNTTYQLYEPSTPSIPGWTPFRTPG